MSQMLYDSFDDEHGNLWQVKFSWYGEGGVFQMLPLTPTVGEVFLEAPSQLCFDIALKYQAGELPLYDGKSIIWCIRIARITNSRDWCYLFPDTQSITEMKVSDFLMTMFVSLFHEEDAISARRDFLIQGSEFCHIIGLNGMQEPWWGELDIHEFRWLTNGNVLPFLLGDYGECSWSAFDHRRSMFFDEFVDSQVLIRDRFLSDLEKTWLFEQTRHYGGGFGIGGDKVLLYGDDVRRNNDSSSGSEEERMPALDDNSITNDNSVAGNDEWWDYDP